MLESFKAAMSLNKSALTQTVPGGSHPITIVDKEEFFEVHGGTVFFEMNDRRRTAKYYRECPPLSYILNKKASFVANARIACVTEKVGANGKAIPTANPELLKVLKYPNPLRTFSQFMAEVNLITDLYGYCPILKVQPDGFDIPSELWVLPPDKLEIKTNDKYFVQDMMEMIDRIEFRYMGRSIPIAKEDVYLFTGQTSTVEDLLFPCSRLHALKYPITNLIYNYESRGTIFQRRGALGILSPENDASGPVRAKPEDREQLQADYRRYGLKKDQYPLIISSIAMRWAPMGMNVAEMQLIEMGNDDIMTLCDALDLKYPLLARGSETTFNNQEQAKRSQYQDTAIPTANNFCEQLTDMMGAEAMGCKYVADFSHVEALKANEKDKADILKTNVAAISQQFQHNLITYGDAMAYLGGEAPSGTAGKFFFEMPAEFQATYSGLKQQPQTQQQ